MTLFTNKITTDMNKSELIKRAAAKGGVTQKQMRDCLDAVLAVVGSELANGGEVVLPDFGKFHMVKIKEHSVRPFGGEPIVLPAMDKVHFKAYANLLLYSAKY